MFLDLNEVALAIGTGAAYNLVLAVAAGEVDLAQIVDRLGLSEPV